MPFYQYAAVFLLAASQPAAQDLAPEVLLLSRIKNHMRQELARVTNYTCLESTARFHKATGWRDTLRPLDTVRLEVMYTNHKEWYGLAGDRDLTHADPAALVGGGMIGNGFFALLVNNVFLHDETTFTYVGEETRGARKEYRYDFRLPRRAGGLTVSLFGGIGTVGEEGSLWVNAASLDLTRVAAKADDIPPYLPLGKLTVSVSYARMRIGEYGALLAQAADLYMLKSSGEESFNHIEYTHCHEFSAQSAVSFDAEPPPAGEPPPPEGAKTPLSGAGAVPAVPPFLVINLQLTTAITDTMAVGTPIAARVAGNVASKGKVVLSDGALVRGRIRRLEQYENGLDFIVGLEFTEVIVNGEAQRFYADLVRLEPRPAIRASFSEPVFIWSEGEYQPGRRTLTLPELPGVASFFVKGKTFRIAPGFRMTWRTRGMIR
jgi:hypothetical protein